MEITYAKVGDYLLPELASSETAASLGMFGRMRLAYLKDNRRALYASLLAEGGLNAHLAEVDGQARAMMDRLTTQMEEREGVNEAMKRGDRMKWVGLKNSIRASAMEAVNRDLIYS